jgi:hypothetical protein
MHKKISWLISGGLFISSILVYHFIDIKKIDWFFSYWGVVGTNVTIVGIIYTLYQINQLKSESKIIQDTTSETKNRIFYVNGYADIAKGISLIQEVQSHIRGKKYEVSLMRLQELKITIGSVKSLNSRQTSPVNMTATIKDLNILINNIEKEISNEGKTLKTTLVNSSLEEILDMLVELKNKLE